MYEISGIVREAGTRLGVPGVIVSAFDKDLLRDDFLGEIMTGPAGEFRIEYPDTAFASLLDKSPDLYLVVKTVSGQRLLTTADAVRLDASKKERIELDVMKDVLLSAGITAVAPETPVPTDFQTRFTIPGWDALDDDLVKQVRTDLEGRSSILEVVKLYATELRGGFDNNALPVRKMARLFELGNTPDRFQGHYYGVAPGLRSGDLRGIAAEYGNFLGHIWGSAINPVCPWGGKSFTPMAPGDRAQVAGSSVPAEAEVARGINHFIEIPSSAINVATTDLLNFMWHLQEVPESERRRYGHDRNGGHFAGYRARSVHPTTPREVYRLNYRYHALGNQPPLLWLIDELVEIASGLYLGQVLFATEELLRRFDPKARDETYHYQHFGYFVLFTEDWNGEARRLFPQLNIPETATRPQSSAKTSVSMLIEKRPAKFTTLTLASPAESLAAAPPLDSVRRDLSECETVIDLLQKYSDSLLGNPDNDSPVFDKLGALFKAGISPTTMNGFYRGALVSWHTGGFLKAFQDNSINATWNAIQTYSPWTGKTFDPVEKARLAELTDGFETGDTPTFFCSNTVRWRTSRERVIQTAAKLAGAWIEEATPDERLKYGYEAKTFFFIGKRAPSIHEPNGGKPVFQFNYRWPALRNPIPDRWCIDEIVQIADGLYLGELFYATNILEPWNPKTEISKYQYQLFAYFLLMDEDWHSRRLRIGYDLEDT